MTLPAPNPVDGRRPGMQVSHNLAPIFSEQLGGEALLEAFKATHGEKGYLEAEEAKADASEPIVSEELKRGMFIRGIVETVTVDVKHDYDNGLIARGAWDSIPTMVGVIASRTAELTLNALKKSEAQGEA
jgi:hypothetical protein